jgi:hypothetical protein
VQRDAWLPLTRVVQRIDLNARGRIDFEEFKQGWVASVAASLVYTALL